MPHVANIGARGIARRRRNGIFWAIATIVAIVIMAFVHAPRWTTLLLVIPIGLAALGVLQAREKT